ncbi:MAG: glycoside hydrolase family 43 protein [Verrucomicrobiota bacterium]
MKRPVIIARFAIGLVLIAASLFSGCGTVSPSRHSAGQSAWLFTSFQDNQPPGLRFLYSHDGYHWQQVPGRFLVPTVGAGKLLRDPSLLRGRDGTFHLVWTTAWKGDPGFGYASSPDLLHWSAQRFIPVMTNEPATVNVWAPELYYNERQRHFLIVWASTIPGRFPEKLEATNNNHRLYFTATRDFETFTPAQLYLDPGFSVIDSFIVKDSGRYVLLHKDNSRPVLGLRVAFGGNPAGPWGNFTEPLTPKFTEGPTALKIGDDWLIYFDAYRDKTYGALRTRDFKTFTDISREVSFPPGHKHGTALSVPAGILHGLLDHAPEP